MAQNLVTLFGSEGAARFLELLESPYRQPVWELSALDEDGDVAFDLSNYLSSFGATPTDEMQSVAASFSLANPDGRFDRYGGADANALAEGRILRFRKGLKDPVDGTNYLLPAFYGRVIQGKPTYSVSSDNTISVTVADELKNPVKQKVTSPAYQNTQANNIAADLLKRWGKFLDARIKLAALDKVYPWAQFPDMPLVDCLKILFEPALFWVRADENGDIVSGPRLGSVLSGFSDIKGYPDQTEPPPSEAVAYVFPDEPGVESIDTEWQDFQDTYNQVRVLGQAERAKEALGPTKSLYRQANSSIGRSDTLLNRYPFSEPAGTQNSVIARNVYVEVEYSTEHELDTDPRTQILSLMKWRGAWSADAVYQPEDAVSHAGNNYACYQAAGSTNPPTDIDHWQEIPVAGPFVSEFLVDNLTDPEPVGYMAIQSVTDGEIILRIEGRGFSRGGGLTVRHRGGFDYRFAIKGQPVLSFSRTLVAFADYNVQTVTGEELTDPFGDGVTFQAPHAPFAMSVPVEVFKDGESLGKIAADGTDLSGETAFSVDFERGRIVLNDLAYRAFEKDEDGSGNHPYSAGGTAQTTLEDFDLDQLEIVPPAELFASYREGDSTYTFSGLVVGQGYDIRLYFADPVSDKTGQRVFSVFTNGRKVVEGLDIVAKAGGAYLAISETITGVAPDSSGEIVVNITQHDPVSGALLPECSEDGEGEEALGLALVSGIEILLPQGQGADPYAVNAGGPAIAADVPDITANYGYSPLQQLYGIQTYEINDPLISTYAECGNVAEYWANFFAWQRHRQTFRAASVPHLQPGDLVRFYSPRINCDIYAYLRQIGRSMVVNGADSDTFSGFLIHAAPRS